MNADASRRAAHLRAALLGLLCLSACALATAQDAGLSTGVLTVPLTVIDGHLIVSGQLFKQQDEARDVALEVSLEYPGALTLHGDLYGKAEENTRDRLVIKPGIELSFAADEVQPERQQQREQMQNAVTRLYAKTLTDYKLKGTIGVGLLKKYRVLLDVAAGRMTLFPPGTAATMTGAVVRPFEAKDDRVWLELNYAEGRSGKLLLGGNVYDTLIDRDAAVGLGKPAGNVSPVWLTTTAAAGNIDLSERIAFRPAALAKDADPARAGAVWISGVNFLEAFRIEIDWSTSRIAFTPAAAPMYPQQDFEFFKAEASGSADEFQAYLQRYPQTRLAREAAHRLIDARQADHGATNDQLLQALQWVADTSLPERRMENCLVYVEQFRASSGRPGLVLRAGTLALQYSRNAVSPQDAYRLHNIIGEAYLQEDRLTEAWRHLLSAAFMPLDTDTGDPLHNISVNLNLARVYDRQGRAARAYSRYVRAQEMMTPLTQQLGLLLEQGGLSPEQVKMSGTLKQWNDEAVAATTRLRQQIPPSDLQVLGE